MEKVLNDIYYNLDSPATYSGIKNVWLEGKKKLPKLKLSEVKEWLANQYTYGLHKPVQYKYERRQVLTPTIDYQWQIDLTDLASLAKDNDGHKYLLTAIDIFSRHAWAEPVKSKRPDEVSQAFQRILDRSGRKPHSVQADKGTEFKASFQTLLKSHDTKFFLCANPDIKCSVIERFHRTLKNRLYKYFTRERTYRYLEALPKLLDAYNNTYHRGIKYIPAKVTKEKEDEVRQLRNPIRKKVSKYSAGDNVRISKGKGLFQRGYLPSWSGEVFTIDEALNSNPPSYKLKDWNDEAVESIFYEPELQLVRNAGDNFYVEKVVRTRSGGNELLIKWANWPEKFNSWVKKADLIKGAKL